MGCALPPSQHPKPKALGSQTAFVTGPPSEEIHCDEYGRIKVQFHWDRDGQTNDNSSYWLRVATGWAGNAYGGITIPRVGMEVLVNFLEGAPDQPLITGCLFHKENVVLYYLPANKTRSTSKTLSSSDDKGYNEFRIEDKKGAEQIYLHAQRDWDENIEHDQKIHVGNERHDTVAQQDLRRLQDQLAQYNLPLEARTWEVPYRSTDKDKQRGAPPSKAIWRGIASGHSGMIRARELLHIALPRNHLHEAAPGIT